MATRRWWELYRHPYELTTSEAVLAELGFAPARKAKEAAALLRPVKLLVEPPELDDVIGYYIDHKVMPAAATGDAYHLAIASLCSVDYLLTWNCKHLANANKMRHISVANQRLGLHVPILTTPLSLMPEAHI
ncbi:MAG: hypothetical protein ACKVS9_07035 [Phycisphaerae bacterium]